MAMNNPTPPIRRIQYYRFGGPEEMKLENHVLPPPGRHEIRVRVRSASVNEIDWRLRDGYLKLITGWRFPRGMGMDFAGVVEQVGPEVSRFAIGDRVMGIAPLRTPGAFAEALITREGQTLLMPDGLDFEAAAALPTVGVTAWRGLLKYGRLQSGQSVFINGAMGGVGRAAAQIARAKGASVIAGRVGPDDILAAGAAGIDPAISYKGPIPPELRHQFDIVFDCHGSLTPAEGDLLVQPGGVILDTNPSGRKRLLAILSRRRKMVFGSMSAKEIQPAVDLASAGQLRIPVGRAIGLEDAIAQIAAMEQGKGGKGKTVIVIP
ncbi:NADP-dependent oxidoreductase [Agrobacterium larrymoorei]|uniref:NADP-dependent oxidoreductase n=1 Tax=Agrobacterium larrymoorei TaxID=160699 RepID=A0A4D7DVE5_9HYPH|nr:NADP-dependent oxidoreductase [Agrobacterium larrymoorei]QCJ01054.1 NADP-dependent oxidoreductase [Agrobacterium larrymoorei]QYA10075.1 NADP-dependent oxidoreductase [Agrobacterium larrymoorei]